MSPFPHFTSPCFSTANSRRGKPEALWDEGGSHTGENQMWAAQSEISAVTQGDSYRMMHYVCFSLQQLKAGIRERGWFSASGGRDTITVHSSVIVLTSRCTDPPAVSTPLCAWAPYWRPSGTPLLVALYAIIIYCYCLALCFPNVG